MKVEEMFFRSPYNYDRDAISEDTGTFCADPSLADQSSKEESDINTIVRRFGISGHLPMNVQPPVYADMDALRSPQECANLFIEAREAFNRLPAAVRRRFDNAQEFVEFCSLKENQAEIDALGLGPIRENVESSGAGDKPAE